MNLQILILLLVVFCSAQSWASQYSHVKVKILKSYNQVILSGFGISINASSIFFSSQTLPVKRKIRIRRNMNGWVIYNFSTQNELYIKEPILRVTGDLIRINEKLVPNDLFFRIIKNDFEIIANVEMDDYLKGVLPSEMPSQWPIEAFKAQAVAARSYVMSLMAERFREPYHVDDTVSHQVFQVEKIQSASQINRDKILAAVEETSGQYLVSQDDRPYRSYFHSDCGGQTEEPKNIWGVSMNYGTVHDERCKMNALSAWSIMIDAEELRMKINFYYKIERQSKIKNISVKSYTTSGRVLDLVVEVESPKNEIFSHILPTQILRQVFGFNRVKSTNFDLQFDPRIGLKLKGRGHGHGAGMCQKGARFMALAGSSYVDIIKRYYPKARLHLPDPATQVVSIEQQKNSQSFN